jgi:sigma-E factor negative regulatory protein RseA
MNKNQGELTSALLDGELETDMQRRTIAGMLDSAPEELDRFGRYRLIGDVLRGDSSVLAVSLADRVRDELQDEPVVLAPQRARPRAWLRPVGGIAMAASVAAAAVMVAPQLMTPGQEDGQPLQVSSDLSRPAMTPTLVAHGPSEPVAQPGGSDTGENKRRWQALNQDLENRLNRLVIEHHEFGGRSGINGPVPHIGFVSYEAR